MWYENDKNNTIRYILGEKGNNPLFCIGINPSTAEPGHLDSTVNKVKTISYNNKYDGWIMLNIYPQRATQPNDLDQCCENENHKKNVAYIDKYLSKFDRPTIWAAWGVLIEKRKFLLNCLEDIFNCSQKHHVQWIHFSKLTKKGHPRHPLYLPLNAKKYNFDMRKYLTFLKSQSFV